jgi:hypothetical protein
MEQASPACPHFPVSNLHHFAQFELHSSQIMKMYSSCTAQMEWLPSMLWACTGVRDDIGLPASDQHRSAQRKLRCLCLCILHQTCIGQLR